MFVHVSNMPSMLLVPGKSNSTLFGSYASFNTSSCVILPGKISSPHSDRVSCLRSVCTVAPRGVWVVKKSVQEEILFEKIFIRFKVVFLFLATSVPQNSPGGTISPLWVRCFILISDNIPDGKYKLIRTVITASAGREVRFNLRLARPVRPFFMNKECGGRTIFDLFFVFFLFFYFFSGLYLKPINFGDYAFFWRGWGCQVWCTKCALVTCSFTVSCSFYFYYRFKLPPDAISLSQ